ncbi:Gfo/Idh/MocA family protein [Gallaecimonas xiamenensis]|uniref:Oxidoreductase, Gfo/Idh/MocA family protein n=1 Tax=Gallaecimonas xiamenensis 3-C-1 TaxID=745411 RepID=K2J4C1_9GAMM|nr:Gfo/Idh/MocA family oxidoreductase [Gallaecimonas xiamenensis]EKE77896.1 oxidoreductase, Gfo/Idh/MocA family protein [Gallaecimonas xiamenensis 3-C-1]
MLRFGVLSTAKIGHKFVLPAINKSPLCTLQAVASRDLARAQDYAERQGAPLAFGSYEALLACPEVDVVYIPLPTHLHVEWTLKALAAGKHVLVEKPMALTAADIDLVAEAAKRHGKRVMEAFMIAFHPQWDWVKSLLAEGRLGRIYKASGHFTYFNKKDGDFRNHPDMGGGGLRDVGVYPIIAGRMALGEPTLLDAHLELDPDYGIDRFVDFNLDFGGARANFYCGTQQERSQYFSIHGELGRIEMNAPFNPMDGPHGARVDLYTDKGSHCESRFFGNGDHYLNMVNNLCQAIGGEAAQGVSLADSRANQVVVDQILAKAKGC